MRINRLWLKFAAVSAAASVIAVMLAAFLIRSATSQDFGRYLQQVRGMGQMMGGGFANMMGPSETEFLNSISRSLWTAGLIAVAVAVVIAILFSRQVTVPLSRLSTAAARVKQGDMSHRVTSKSTDEVGALATTFNSMVETLDKNQEMRRKLMADLAHEMGTPLAVLQSNLEGMLDGVVEASPSNISSLHQEALLLSRLVRDLRTLAQAESGRLTLALAPGDLPALVSSVVTATEAEARRKGISLSEHAEPGLPPAMMDRDRVSQTVVNLLSNALRYTSAGGAVAVSTSLSREGVAPSLLVSVADTGQGISEQDLPHIFDHYYRGTQVPERRADGSGIGLAVVKELVEAHKGRVWVESTMGEGSTFYFTLPVSD
jgi:two-component system, OmpR family, sensor histidine kinase BaeS